MSTLLDRVMASRELMTTVVEPVIMWMSSIQAKQLRIGFAQDQISVEVDGRESIPTGFDRVQKLAEHLIWIAPVGNDDSYQKCDDDGNSIPVPALRGFMVCKRCVNNVDGRGNTRVDFLRIWSNGRGDWKKPFRENECMFPSFHAALRAAELVIARQDTEVPGTGPGQ